VTTYLSAAFANPDGSAVVAQTAERGAVLLSAADTPEAWVAMLAAVTPAPYVAPPPPPRTIAKTAIYRRMTDAELVRFDAALAALPLRDRLLWQDAEGGTVYVHEVKPAFAAALGAERAAELLAP
jgi:hypothetical protein